MNHQDDRELLELAAKAAGISVDCNVIDVHRALPMWNPLQDDGDALRLAVRLHITPTWKWYADRAVCDAWSYYLDDSHGCISVEESLGDDEGQATRRAIVRAAAELGRRMP